MRNRSWRPLSIAAGLLLVVAIVQARSPDAGTPELLDHMAADPLVVWASRGSSPAEVWDGWMELVGRLGSAEDRAGVEAALAGLDARIDCSIRDDLLARIGPEYAVVLDVPPIDRLVGAASADDASLAGMLDNLGLLALVERPAALDRCLRKLLAAGELPVTDEDGLARIELGEGESGAFPVYYGLRKGVLAIGPSPEFVRASFRSRAEGQRLADGEDFAEVFRHLDRAPDSLAYVNLPKVRTLLEGSEFLQGVLASDPEARQVLSLFLDPEFSASGLGSTSVAVGSGTRTTSFGPPGLTGGFGGVAGGGLVAAIALPNLLNAVERGKQKRTMADLRSVGIAVEEYSIDNNAYPGPTAGWVPLERVAGSLAPVYIRALPTSDGWGHPLQFWSDGASYRIVSPGKDGEIERDWSGEIDDCGGSTDPPADIVFGDGVFICWPDP